MQNFSKNLLSKSICFFMLFFVVTGCSDIDTLEVKIAGSVRIGDATPLTIIKTGSGSSWNFGDKDGFNYSFSSIPEGSFTVEVLEGKENDYCRSRESSENNDGTQRNEVVRDMLIKEKNPGEITLAISCHKPIYRFTASDSVVTVQMVIEDNSDKVRDTVVFKIVR